MRSSLTLFAAACAVTFALSASAGAETVTPILTFGENTTSPAAGLQTDYVRATLSGTTTTLSTVGPPTLTTPPPTPPTTVTNSIPITLGQLGILSGPLASGRTAFETFMPALSGSNATGFDGTILFTSGAGGTGDNYLTVMITNGQLTPNGNAFNFSASDGTVTPGGTSMVTLTSTFTPVILAMGGTATDTTFTTKGVVAIGLTTTTNVGPQPAGTQFTAVNGGTISSLTGVIPEPASFLSASTAILAGLGCFGWSRRKSSKA